MSEPQTSEPQTSASFGPGGDEPDPGDGHLRYLLTAYLLGDISPAGRAEVEAHLGICTACREEARELGQVLALTTESLRDEPLPPVPYAFEARRLERVLGAARRRRSPRRFLVLASTAIAACVMIAVVIPSLMKSRRGPMAGLARMSGMRARTMARSGGMGPARKMGQSRSIFGFLAGGEKDEDREVASRQPARSGRSWGDPPSAPPASSASTLTSITVGRPLSKTEAAKNSIVDDAVVDLVAGGTGLVVREGRFAQGGGQAAPKRPAARIRLQTPGAGGRTAGDVLIVEGKKKNKSTFYESYDISGIAVPGKKAPRLRVNEQLAADSARAGDEAAQAYKPAVSRRPRAGVGVGQPAAGPEAPAKEAEGTESVYASAHGRAAEQAAAMEAARKAAEASASLAKAERSRRSALLALHGDLDEKREERKRIAGELAAPRRLADKEKGVTAALASRERTLGAEKQRLAEAREKYDEAVRSREEDRKAKAELERRYRSDLEHRTDDDRRTADAPVELYAGVRRVTVEAHAWQIERPAGGKRSHESDAITIKGMIRNGIGAEGGNRSLAGAAALERELRARRYYRVGAQQATRTPEVPAPAIGDEGLGREGFRKRYHVNPFVDTRRDHLSTFAMDVDTASYSRTRALLRAGRLPDPKTVRVEEFINAFPDARQADPNRVFSVYTEGAPAPFGNRAAGTPSPVSQAAARPLETIKITVKARELRPGERRPAVLTLAVDISGSMALGGRLQQVRGAIAGLLDALEPTDRVAVVAYGSEAYLALPHTPARERARILGALDAVRTGGSTNVQAGLRLAYRVADESRAAGAWNRVIICSDGVATSGAREADALLLDVKLYARRGIDLTVLGFGKRGYNDAFLERLADQGNGNYAFCASAEEGARLFRTNLPKTLSVLARDAKIQVDFDPWVVASYRLLGYENRDIKDQDFRNDTVDAGEVGPGTQVTALYEIQRHPGAAGPLGRVFLRYRSTVTRRVEEVSFPIPPGVVAPELQSAPTGLRFTACVAELAELLRQSYWARDGSFADLVRELDRLRPALGRDPRWREVRELAVRAGQLTVRRLLQGNR